VARLCFDGSNRQPKFILPAAADRLRAGGGVAGLALVSALWARYCAGETDSGKAIAPNDPNWDALQAAALAAKADPAAFLRLEHIFGPLGRDPAYVAAFTSALQAVWKSGTRETLRSYLAGGLR
jgi:mannitol 2-dehydrogenase